MKAVLALFTVAAVLVAGVLALRNSTQYHNYGNHGRSTTVTFSVKEKDTHGNKFAADALWQYCINSLAWDTTDSPVPVGSGFRASVHPGLGSDGERRLKGCIDDLVLDRIKGHVRSVRTS